MGDTAELGERLQAGQRGADRWCEVHVGHAHVHRRVRVERAGRHLGARKVQPALESVQIQREDIGCGQRLRGRQVDDDHAAGPRRCPELVQIALDGADELARPLPLDDGGRRSQMLLAGGQLVLHQTDQLGREWPDVAAERVRRFDQRRVEEVVAAEDERVERSQSGRAERVALGHEPDGAGVAVPERDGADDGRGCDGPARADEPHPKRLADGSSLTGRHAVHLHGREPVLSRRQVILGLPPGGVKEREPPERRVSRLRRPAAWPYILCRTGG